MTPGGRYGFAINTRENAAFMRLLGQPANVEALEAFAEKFDFSPYHTLCDVGGATGLLSIERVMRAPRTGRNPQTGEPIKIPAKRVCKFRLAKQMKDAVLGGKK